MSQGVKYDVVEIIQNSAIIPKSIVRNLQN